MFEEAYKRLIEHEGGYVFDIDDPGGETYKGISRVHHPEWPGWKIIDEIKDIEETIALNIEPLEVFAKEFYKKNYWDVFSCDRLIKSLQLEIFEQAVNLGINKTTKHIQIALNALNNQGKYWQDLKEDGVFGPVTFGVLNKAQYLGGKYIPVVLNVLQGSHYLQLMRSEQKFEKYLGWFNRVNLEIK